MKEKILYVLIIILGAALYLELAANRKLTGAKDLSEKQLTETITQLKLTNTELTDKSTELSKFLDKANKEKQAILIKLNSVIKESISIGEQLADGSYALFIDNNKSSPELGRINLLSDNKVQRVTHPFFINSEILVAQSPTESGAPQYRVLVQSSFVSQAKGTEYYNKPYPIPAPTGETFIQIPTNVRDFPRRFYMKPLKGAINLGINSDSGAMLTKTFFGYSDLNILSLGISAKGTIDGVVEAVSMRPMPSVFTNTRIGVGAIPAKQLPILTLSVEL